MSGSAWPTLELELDAWSDAGRRATFWWRDDDAGEDTPAFARLLSLAERHRTPLSVAAIPQDVTSAAADRLRNASDVAVLQHGYAHINHAPPAAKKAEYCRGRSAEAMLAELRAGQKRLASLVDGALLPVLTPPWNRLDAALTARLPEAGITGLSTYLARGDRMPAPGVVQVNCHIDIVDWRGNRGFIGQDAALNLALAHLRARRTNGADPDEPTGLLSHHLVQDEACWHFIDRFIAETRRHAAAHWPTPAELFR